MKYKTIDYTTQDSILTLTLSRPDHMNAFTTEMSHELIDAFSRASDDDAVGAIVITGAGKAFCAGMDLNSAGNVFGLNESLNPTLQDMRERSHETEIEDGVRDSGGRVVLAMYDCKKPIIGAINGAAVGIGATMACAMDIRLASEKARVGFVFNKIGITPEACSSWFLPRLVGMQTALEWCYTAEILSAETLLKERFVKAVYAPEDLLNEAYALAARMVNFSQVSMALTRQMMYRNSAQDHPMKAHEVDSLAIYYASQNSGKEGVQSFLDKRAPNFTQKASTDMPSFYPWWK
ncbi:MAG: enoyl-CoA hydratase/carnithine racemase [Porticoccaceae bacterium]|jgi:enoyl-CoA hydratase/carnithine racemase|nr:MAG: putative enoyl-CoA hydratase echA12 [Porticoccaceae bacterium UBA1117]|tara:strand:- start:547 stop:1422 length:876 start_codon:yes stop_codon:yes gene_type:complete